MKIFNILSLCFVSTLIVTIYYKWFIYPDVIGGDWPYFYSATLKETPFLPPSWHEIFGNGLGGISPVYGLQAFLYATIYLSNIFLIPWQLMYKIFWFGLFIFLSIFSSIVFLKKICKSPSLLQILTATIIYTTNTYILLVVGGGQMGVGLAYAVLPLVIGYFFHLIDQALENKSEIKTSIIASLILALQIMFDPRISFLSMIAVGLYVIFRFRLTKKYLFSLFFYVGVVPLSVACFLHASWILPSIIFHTSPTQDLGTAYTSVSSLKFFSFADFSHSFSLLHPNWPENVFGKVSFLFAQFLLLPIIAYSALFFVSKKKSPQILFFAFLGIVGSFLAKGMQMPFGEINSFLFEHIPGFFLFRDPTKFYIFIAISYTVLISYSVEKTSSLFGKSWKIYIPFFIFIMYWIYLIFPAPLGKLGTTFTYHSVPSEYQKFASFLSKDKNTYRILWLPKQHRFSFYSNSHPAVEAQPLLNAKNVTELVKRLQSDKTEKYLQDINVKYVVIPYDPDGEIFFKDRKFDKKQYEKTIHDVKKIQWLKPVSGYTTLAIFEVPNTKTHTWLENNGSIVEKRISTDSYLVTITTDKPTKVVFTESYSPFWIATVNGKNIHAKRNKNNLNIFEVSNIRTYTMKITFIQKDVYLLGWVISGITLLACISFLLYEKRFKK